VGNFVLKSKIQKIFKYRQVVNITLILCTSYRDIALQLLQEIVLALEVLSLYVWIYCLEITFMTVNKATKLSNGEI